PRLGRRRGVVDAARDVDPWPTGDRRYSRRAAATLRRLASRVQHESVKRPGWLVSLLVGCVATAVALRLQVLIRDVWQIRSLPERVMEWLLLFVPLSVFERGLQQFGANAKEFAL